MFTMLISKGAKPSCHLICREQDVVSEPFNGWRRISLDVAFKISVELKSLADALADNFDGRRELDFDVDIASSSNADDVRGDAVVSASVLLLYSCKLQSVSLVDRPGNVRQSKHGTIISSLQLS